MTSRKSTTPGAADPSVATSGEPFMERQEAARAARSAKDAAKAGEAAQARERAAEKAQAAQGGPLWEVLTEGPTGHRTVHRFRALDRESAVQAVEESDTDGELEILDVAMCMAGRDGLGSNDITPEQMMARLKDGVDL